MELTVEQKKALDSVAKSEVWIKCYLCSETFLETDAEIFTFGFQMSKPSKEYLKASLHWLDTKHPIVAKLHGSMSVLSNYWEDSLVRVSEEQMRKYLESKLK